MGYQTTKLSANTEYPVRAWLKNINTTNTEECLTSLYAGDVTQITYYPTTSRQGYQIYFAEDHNFQTGDLVTITGVTPSNFNVTNAEVKVVADDQIEVALPKTNPMYNSAIQADADSFAALLIKAHVYAHLADLLAYSDTRVANNADVYIGPIASNVGPTAVLAPTNSMRFEATPGGKLPLSGLNIYGTQGDGVIIYFH